MALAVDVDNSRLGKKRDVALERPSEGKKDGSNKIYNQSHAQSDADCNAC